MASEITVAENQDNGQVGEGMVGGGILLTTWEIRTTGGTMQIASGICFHSVYVNSHTQYTCAVNIVNCMKKNMVTPGGKSQA